MEQVIYGDVLFLINFSMDFLTLFLTAKLLSRKIHLSALLFASALGGVYGVAAVFLEGNLLTSVLIHIAVSVLLCYISFGTRLLPCTALFYGIGCVLGGGMTALYSLLNRIRGQTPLPASQSASALSGVIPPGWMAVTAAVCGIVTLVGGRFAKKRRLAPEADVSVRFRGRCVTFRGLTDTGNFLTEPLSGAPVIVLPLSAISPLLSPGLLALFQADDLTALGALPHCEARRVRVIPLSGVKSEGILTGFLPDTVEINGVSREACLACADVKNPVIPAVLL